MGDCEAGTLVSVESTLKYHPDLFEVLTLVRESGSGTVHGRQFDWGGLLPKGNGGVRRYLRAVGHRPQSAMAKACLTARPTSRAGTKVGHSDPVVLYGRAIAQRIKGTLGITG